MRPLLFLFCLLFAASLSAQQYDWDDFVEEYTSDVERAEEEDLQLHLQELKELSAWEALAPDEDICPVDVPVDFC